MKKKRKNSLHVIREADHIFETWAHTEKEARHAARYKMWARGPHHVGLRRILQVVAGEPWPVLIEEANYITLARERAQRAPEVTPQLTAADREHLAATRRDREAAEEAAHAAKLVAMRADQADRRVRRAALDARLGIRRPIFDLPLQDPDTLEWI